MKLIITILTLVVISYSGYAQTGEPFKGAKTIVLNCSDSSTTLYKSFGQHLISKGAIIEQSNGDFLTLRTAPTATTRYNLLFYLNITIINHKVRLNTFYKINVDHLVGVGASSFDTWSYAKGKDNALNVIYLDLMKMIEGFPIESVEYHK